MAIGPAFHTVYRSINKPLTIMGAERRLFFLALSVGAGSMTFFGSFMAGLLMFVTLHMMARLATTTDPQVLRILANASRLRARYDPSKFRPYEIIRVRQ